MTGGEIIAGPHVRDACKRHLDDLERADLTFDVEAAARVFRFFRTVIHLAGGEFEGRPFELLGWQQFVVGSLFGWKRQDGTRRFRTAYIEIGKGAGKTPLCAGIGLYMLCADGEARAEIYAGAYNQDQAQVLFRGAVAMVQQSPDLTDELVLSGGIEKNNIAYLPGSSFFRPISSERQGRGKSGPIPHCALLDELHEHPTNAMVEFLSAGVKHRRQPLVILITNSGSDRQTVCWDYHEYSTKVAAQQRENDAFFAYVCALDDGDEPFKDEGCWIKANPSLPTIPGVDYVRQQVAGARGMPSKETLVRRLNFCQWTDAADAWLEKDIWMAAQADLDLADYKGEPCYGGLDLSISADLTSLCLLFPRGDRTFHAFSWSWMPGDRLLDLEVKDGMAPRYQQWRDAGELQAPPGKVIDYRLMASFLAEIAGRFEIQAIAYDRAKIEYLRTELDMLGLELPLLEHGQGFYKASQTGLWMPGSIEETEAALREGRLKVNRNRVLTWGVGSVVCQQSSINPTDRYFSKRKASGRIDPAVALVQAMGAATMREEDEGDFDGFLADPVSVHA